MVRARGQDPIADPPALSNGIHNDSPDDEPPIEVYDPPPVDNVSNAPEEEP